MNPERERDSARQTATNQADRRNSTEAPGSRPTGDNESQAGKQEAVADKNASDDAASAAQEKSAQDTGKAEDARAENASDAEQAAQNAAVLAKELLSVRSSGNGEDAENVSGSEGTSGEESAAVTDDADTQDANAQNGQADGGEASIIEATDSEGLSGAAPEDQVQTSADADQATATDDELSTSESESEIARLNAAGGAAMGAGETLESGAAPAATTGAETPSGAESQAVKPDSASAETSSTTLVSASENPSAAAAAGEESKAESGGDGRAASRQAKSSSSTVKAGGDGEVVNQALKPSAEGAGDASRTPGEAAARMAAFAQPKAKEVVHDDAMARTRVFNQTKAAPEALKGSGSEKVDGVEVPRQSRGLDEAAAAKTRTTRGRFLARQPELAQRIVNLARGAGKGGRQSMRILLNPPHLGSVKVEITADRGSLDVNIRAETPAARQLLAQNLRDLEARLRDGGLGVGQLNVSVSQEDSGRPERDTTGSGDGYVSLADELESLAEAEHADALEAIDAGKALGYVNGETGDVNVLV